jgi:predicted ATPase
MDNAVSSFGPYTLSRRGHWLKFAGTGIPLRDEDFDILAALIEAAGTPLQARALLSRLGGAAGKRMDVQALWARVASINQVLDTVSPEAGHISHHPADGYALVLAHGSGAPAGSVIGREEVIGQLAAQLPRRRFVTIVGPGGIGKTTVAQALASRVSPSYRDGVVRVDLSPLADPGLLPGTLQAALGIPAAGGSALPAQWKGRRLLLVLDSCEHLIDAAAALAEQLVSGTDGVHVLATSREPLRAAGEWVHRLAPMDVPAHSQGIAAADALRYSAVHLFVDRARRDFPFPWNDATAQATAHLCRRLDGMPLAIELAAARAAVLGVEALASEWEAQRFKWQGRKRGAPARHHTLAAMLDWSHELLSSREKAVFRRLGVFNGSFTLDSAVAVVSAGLASPADAAATVLELVAKSLVGSTPAPDATRTRLRLLDTTRAYARLRLDGAAEESASTRELHARDMLRLLGAAESAWTSMTRGEWRSAHAPLIDDVRAALQWCFGAHGNVEVGVRLTCAAFVLADQTSLMADFDAWNRQALQALASLPGRDPVIEARLLTTRFFFHQSTSLSGPALAASLEQALELAQRTGDARNEIGPLTALWGLHFTAGAYPPALAWSRRLLQAARRCQDREPATVIGRRTLAQSLHYLGHNAAARRLAGDVLDKEALRIPIVYFPSSVEVSVSMRILLARTLWLQGFPDRAARMAAECMALTRSDLPLPACQVLALASLPIAIWRGEWAACHALAARLRDEVASYAFAYWEPWSQAYEWILASGLSRPPPVGMDPVTTKLRDHLGTFAPALLCADTVSRVEAGTVGWCGPEALRARGEQLLLRSPPASPTQAQAQVLFQRALAMARQHGSLAWELRAATSLARLWRDEGRRHEARVLLRPILGRFSEGFDTADLLVAASLLWSLDDGAPAAAPARPP